METITITENIQYKRQLPAKAVGTWAIKNRGEEFTTLHILKKDGSLGSDRKNNIYKIENEILDEILPKPKIAKVIDVPIGTRKSKWIDGLIASMNANPFLSAYIEKHGEENIRAKIIEDTNAERTGGKVYSSVSTAIKVWNARIRKGA